MYLNNQLKKINKKPKIRKETNIPNSKINIFGYRKL